MMEFQSRWLGIVAVAVVFLLGGTRSTCGADYVYGGTQLSWEWLTDASRAIVVGPVTSLRDSGFELKVDRVLKCRQLAIEPGQVVGAPVLGRTQLYAQHENISLKSGWPALLDSSTYPDDRKIRDRPWKPTFFRAENWTRGDRCLIFFGQDLQSPLQIINLDRPVKIEVEFLAIDMLGQVVTEADDLIRRIESRVAATTTEHGEARVRSSGFNTYLIETAINGQDYYHIQAPPERKAMEIWPPGSASLPNKLETQTEFTPYRNKMGEETMLPQAIIYWYLSKRSEKDFSDDAKEERNMAVRDMLANHANWPSEENSPFSTTAQKVGVSEFCRNQIYRCHRTNYQTYPLGWLCVMSYDKKHIAYLDGHTLMVYTVDETTKQADRLVLTHRGVHRARSYVEFCQDGRMMAFTTEDNSLCLANLQDGSIVWTSKAAFPKSENSTVTVCMEFSHDQRYLVQESKEWTSDLPSSWGRLQRAQVIHVLDVAKGEVVFMPYRQWRDQLRYVSFHPNDSSRLRLHDAVTPTNDTLWSIRSNEFIQNVAEGDPWPND
jgi:hypothetical protein